SGGMGRSAPGERLEAAHGADAQAGGVADRDLGLVELHAALHRVEGAERGAVQVDLGDGAGLGHGQVHGGGHADGGFDHAADHAVDAVDGGDVGDAHGVGDAAGLHQLDVDDVGGAALDQVDHLGRAEHAFVGHDRRVDPLGDVLQALDVARRHRLLQQLQVHARVLQRVDREHGLLRRPALVGVEAEQGAAVDRRVDGLDPLDVQADVLADLDLQRLEAAVDRGQRVGHHLVDVVHADGQVGGDHRVA